MARSAAANKTPASKPQKRAPRRTAAVMTSATSIPMKRATRKASPVGDKQAKRPDVKADPMVGKATQFKPGQSGNPAGRPPGSRNFKTIVRELFEDGGIDWSKVPIKNARELEKKFGKRGGEALSYVLYAKGISGDVPAAKTVHEWAYGKNVDITTGGAPLMPIALDGAVLSRIQKHGGTAPSSSTTDRDK